MARGMKVHQAIEALSRVVGTANCLIDPTELEIFAVDWRHEYRGRPLCAVRPGTVEEVAAVVRLCQAMGLPIVPQGGNTGLVGGAVPVEGVRAVVLNLRRLNRIRETDALDFTITVDSGCTVGEVQEAAAAADRLFPLSFGAEGTAQIGGALSTNAGGFQTIRYGTARDLLLGLEVVLPDGRIWNGLDRVRKNNTGYDLKHLFVGAEGTLGVVTGAVLKLFPMPRRRETTFAALPSAKAAIELLARLLACGGELVAFELMSRFALDVVLRHGSKLQAPFAASAPYFVLAEVVAATDRLPLRDMVESCLTEAIEAGLVGDVVLANSQAQRAALWRPREIVGECLIREGAIIRYDVAVPVSRVSDFIARAEGEVDRLVPGARPAVVGHVGDGNLHFEVVQPEDANASAFLAREHELNEAVLGMVVELGGSFSAEHGIGQAKRGEMSTYKPGVAIDLMRGIKRLLDAAAIMNPGKLLP